MAARHQARRKRSKRRTDAVLGGLVLLGFGAMMLLSNALHRQWLPQPELRVFAQITSAYMGCVLIAVYISMDLDIYRLWPHSIHQASQNSPM